MLLKKCNLNGLGSHADVYLGCKLRFSFDRLAAAAKACKAAWARQASEYGRHVEAQDLVEQGGGTSCAICQVPLW